MHNADVNTPLVSILIPTHERPHYLSIALASVVKQTYKNIEIIVSDNSMGNETELIVRDFQSKYDNIRYVHTPGISAGDNWQTCWDNMSPDSEYVNFLMDDDIFAFTKIEKMMSYFIKNPALALVTSYRKLIDADGNMLDDCDFNEQAFATTSLVDGKGAAQQIVLSCCNWIGEPTTVLFNRRYTDGTYKGWLGDDKYAIPDYMLWLKLLQYGDMVYITEPLSFYRQHDSNDTYNIKTHIIACISLALMIQKAWNSRIYLCNADELREAILSWFNAVLKFVKLCYEINPKICTIVTQ